MKRLKGFTLIELLVSTALSLILLSGLSVFLVSTYSFFKKQMLVADFQERLRFVFYVIGRDIENAGFLGCAKGATNLPQGYGTLYISIPPSGSEVKLAYALGDKWLSYKEALSSKNIASLKKGKYILASTCEKAVVFKNEGDKPLRAALAEFVNLNFQGVPREIQIAPITFIIYSLDKKEKKLYRQELEDNKQELIPEVRSLQVTRKQNAITVRLTFKVGDSDLTEARTFYLENHND